MRKLNLHSVIELTHWALANGLTRNLFLSVTLCLLLSPSEAFPALGSDNVRETAGKPLYDPDAEMRASIRAKRAAPVKPSADSPVTFHAPTIKALERAVASGTVTTDQRPYLWSVVDRQRLNPVFLGRQEKGRWVDVKLITHRVGPDTFAMLNERGQPVRVVSKWLLP